MNELTEHYAIPKPNPAHDVADDVVPLQQAFDLVDAALYALAQAVAAKAAAIHSHEMAAITGLVDALAGKMAASRTFTLEELVDVVGAAEALNNYILTKIDGAYVFRSALSVLGTHEHAIAEVTGLEAALDALDSAIADTITALGDKADASALANYLPKAGGTMTGRLNTASPAGGAPMFNLAPSTFSGPYLRGDLVCSDTGYLWFCSTNGAMVRLTSDTILATLTNKTYANPILEGTPEEPPFTIPDASGYTIDPANGSTQLWTLGANRTPVLTSITDGKAVRVGIDDGAGYTLTLPGVTWRNNGGAAPTLKSTGYTFLLIENLGGTLYADLLGDAG